MKSKTHRELFVEPLGGIEFLIGEVYYTKGGANYFTGNGEHRGYYFSVAPETRETREVPSIDEPGKTVTIMTTGFGMFTGTKILLKQAERFNLKELERINPTQEQIDTLKTHVLGKRERDKERQQGKE